LNLAYKIVDDVSLIFFDHGALPVLQSIIAIEVDELKRSLPQTADTRMCRTGDRNFHSTKNDGCDIRSHIPTNLAQSACDCIVHTYFHTDE
jgi:hypothetical protein